jgi:hypothetical protein
MTPAQSSVRTNSAVHSGYDCASDIDTNMAIKPKETFILPGIRSGVMQETLGAIGERS